MLETLQNKTVYLSVAMFAFSFLFIPAFVYGVVILWAVAYLFMFMHLGRALCQFSLQRYEVGLSYTHKAPKFKWIVIGLCAYLSLPFLAYIYIMGDLSALISGGLDRAVILSLPLAAVKLPIDGDPRVFQMIMLQQLLLSFIGLGGGMLFARKEIAAMSLPYMPQNKPWSDGASREEKIKHNNLWGTYYFLNRAVLIPAIFSLIFALCFFGRFWADSDIHIFEYVFVLPSIIFMPYVMLLHFFAIAFNCVTWFRIS